MMTQHRQQQQPAQSLAEEAESPTTQCLCGYSLFPGQQCPECGRSFAEATKPKPTSDLWGLSVVALFAAFFCNCGLRCMCGHMDAFGLIFTTPTVAAAWAPFIFARESRSIQRSITIIAVVCATALWIDNICDMLWFGHEPLF